MSEITTIKGSFTWTFEDVKIRQEVLAGRPVTIAGKLTVYSTLGGIIVIALTLFFITNKRSLRSFFDDPVLVVAFLVVIPILYLVILYSHNANLKKGFLQSPDNNKRIEVTFTRDEIIMKAEGIYENRWTWNTIKEVQQNPKGFCFFIAEQAGFWIPIRAFQSQEDINSIVELAKRLTPKFKVLG